MTNRISATIIADSLNEFGQRLTTYVLQFPRIVLAEFNTHRMISKNSASSRAIPFKTMVKKVQEEPFVPIAWQKDHKGMQGNAYHTDASSIQSCEDLWLLGRDAAVQCATALNSDMQVNEDSTFTYGMNVTKQLCNRLLEPFLYHTVICTGTEWENFFALRAHEAAEIHIADLAQKMLVAYNESTPKRLKVGEWHIPFGDIFDDKRILELNELKGTDWEDFGIDGWLQEMKVKIATARCARVSYLNFEGKDDYEADIRLHDMLLQSGHMSPFEHCARAMSVKEREQHISGKVESYYVSPELKGWSGNFKGFVQYRKMQHGENKKDERVIRHDLG